MMRVFMRDMLVSFGVCAVIGAILVLASIASAQEWRRTPVEGAMLARIIVSERSAVLRERDAASVDASEFDWFASVVINNRDRFPRARSWLAIMGELSPHVTMRKPTTTARQEWTSTLVGCTERQPAGWIRERDGKWDIYALRWQSFCIDIRDRWVRGDFEVHEDAIAWGSVDDSKRRMCRPKNPLCLLHHFSGGNLFFALAGSAACRDEVQESFVEAHCEGRR